jgi:hypothetical protein
VRLDVLGIVRIYDMASNIEVAHPTGADCLVTKHPIVLSVSLRREAILSLLE